MTKHQKRISGPMLDRIDIHIEVPRVDYDMFIAFIRAKQKVEQFDKLI